MRNIILLSLLVLVTGCSTLENKESQLKIKSTVYQNNDKLSYCYKKALSEKDDLEGEMALEWDVDYRSGQELIRNVEVKSSNVPSETLAQCIKTAITGMHFNLPTRHKQKVHRVSYPFVFKNDESSDLKRR
jgi:hypothetical protein